MGFMTDAGAKWLSTAFPTEQFCILFIYLTFYKASYA